MMGNKGGVSISFRLNDKLLQFVCCHLHSGLEGVKKRNDDVEDIMNQMVYRTSSKRVNKVASSVSVDIVSQPLPDVLIFLGDLNYRVNGYKPSILQCIKQNRYDILIDSEQLGIEKTLGNVP